MKLKASLLIATLLASVPCFADYTYQVSTSVYSDGTLLASPTMLVEADKEASIKLGTDFSYFLTLKPNKDETVDVITAVTVGDRTITPSLTVANGKEATIKIGSQTLTLLVNKVGS